MASNYDDFQQQYLAMLQQQMQAQQPKKSPWDMIAPIMAGVVGAATPGLGRGVALGAGIYNQNQDNKRLQDVLRTRMAREAFEVSESIAKKKQMADYANGLRERAAKVRNDASLNAVGPQQSEFDEFSRGADSQARMSYADQLENAALLASMSDDPDRASAITTAATNALNDEINPMKRRALKYDFEVNAAKLRNEELQQRVLEADSSPEALAARQEHLAAQTRLVKQQADTSAAQERRYGSLAAATDAKTDAIGDVKNLTVGGIENIISKKQSMYNSMIIRRQTEVRNAELYGSVADTAQIDEQINDLKNDIAAYRLLKEEALIKERGALAVDRGEGPRQPGVPSAIAQDAGTKRAWDRVGAEEGSEEEKKRRARREAGL
jgi:hypothetical protein